MSTLLTRIEDGVAYVTLNRPEKYNSFNKEMALALQAFLTACNTNDEVRVVYLTGAGKGFCAGQDLAEVTAEDGPELRAIVKEHYNPLIEIMRNLEKPIVCAVNGVAAGAGANIALAADIVVASESATFIQAFSKIGLIPDSAGTYFLPRLIGMQKASALMMLGDKICAMEAERMGMIYKYFSDNVFELESTQIAITLAKMPTKAFAYTKKALNESMYNNLTEQLAVEEEYQTICGQSHDFNEGVSAFLEKRKPEYIGK